MNTQRLLRLADELDAIAKDERRRGFHMESWQTKDHDKLAPCGFAGCAGGWATRMPEFKADGLSMNEDLEPMYEYHIGFQALRVFLGTTEFDTEYLFDPCNYEESFEDIKPESVAARIRELIASEAKP